MMIMERNALFLLAQLLVFVAVGQVSVDRPIELSGQDDAQRQVLGVPNSVAPEAILSAEVEQTNLHRTAQASLSTSWSVTIPGLAGSPQAGTQLMVLAPEGSMGEVEMMVNGSGPYPLVTGAGEAFAPDDLVVGTPLSVVFDGTAFHVMNGSVYSRKPCATGMVAANEQFCVELNERGPLDFFQAAIVCGSRNTRLCTWGEFIVACTKRVELGLTNATNNWEWVDDATNEDGSARVSGSNQCGSSGNGLVTGSVARNFRCCHTR